MGTDDHIEELRELVRRKYHHYVQVSTQFQLMGKGPHRVSMYEQVMQASRDWRQAQQQFLLHTEQTNNSRANTSI